MQFVLHDWRTPRAAHKFGYDHSRWVGMHVRGGLLSVNLRPSRCLMFVKVTSRGTYLLEGIKKGL
jgi:hypothetical protein